MYSHKLSGHDSQSNRRSDNTHEYIDVCPEIMEADVNNENFDEP